MKKIDGTLFSPVENREREKVYVETIADAVVLHDGQTLKDKFDNRGNGFIISTTKPNTPCVWLMPTDINPEETFNFSDIDIRPDEDDTKICSLKTPVDRTGVRQNVYPLVGAENVKISGNTTINDIVNMDDMGVELSRNKPKAKALWFETTYEAAIIDDFGKTEEVIILNDMLSTETDIGHTHYVANKFIFEIYGSNYAIFNSDSDIVSLNDTRPNKSCLWIDKSTLS